MANEQETPQPLEPQTMPPWLARVAVAGTIVLIVVGVVLVGWRWMHVQFPNAALFIRGDANCEGVNVVVSNADGDPVFHDRMSAANKYQLVVLVEHGVYAVVGRRDDREVIRERLYVGNGGGALLQVQIPSATQPAAATAPSAEPDAPQGR
ncbi:hypothetical protein [Humisphaera borealis]|uniref:Uncharacterized protein n=1 Tax=Humisphaera borealis TaxID=2807512 RepID=A0A7M2X1E9_9BACT|nr:hypothetical protein [Humisphaera borealis]QOV91568.1 hypothetical protein IPV69_09495 [Humisphaera borealis]